MNELHLFAGCGGGILGGMLLGHRTVCAVEIEPYRRKSLLQRQRDGILPRFPIWDDVRTFNGNAWRGKVDIVCGGFPCQDISVAGTKTGISGPKSGLWSEMFRIICEIRPKHAFIENSSNLTFRGLCRVLSDLASVGHNAKWGVLSAADAIWNSCDPCADHLRNRIWIVSSVSNPNGSGCSRAGSTQSEKRRSDTFAAWGSEEISNTNVVAQNGRTQRIGWWSMEPEEAYKRLREGGCDATVFSKTEPKLGRVADGISDRMDRLAAIGDGQVPAVVKLAWETLIG